MDNRKLTMHLNPAKSLSVRLWLYCAILATGILIFDLSIPLGVAGGVPYVAVILISLWFPDRKLVLYLAIVCSVLTVVGLYFSPQGGEIWKVLVNRSLALFAIWVTAILVMQWKQIEERNNALLSEISNTREKLHSEKEKIYLATIHGTHHIINNLLNKLQLVKMEAEKQSNFDEEVLKCFDEMIDEAVTLVKSLSDVEEMDDDKIRQSVYPKEDTSQ